MTADPKSIDLSTFVSEHLERAEPDLLRSMLQAFVEALMGAEADAICGAPYGARSPERTNSRNGYRAREWDTRTGSVELALPKLRTGSYFPDWLLEKRGRAERVDSGSAASFASTGVSAPVAAGSSASFFATTTDVAGNVSGCSTTSARYAVAAFTGTAPTRVLDTRVPIGAPSTAKLGAGATMTLTVPGLPAAATAVALNVTVTDPTAHSYLSVYLVGAGSPTRPTSTMSPGRPSPTWSWSPSDPAAPSPSSTRPGPSTSSPTSSVTTTDQLGTSPCPGTCNEVSLSAARGRTGLRAHPKVP